MRAGGPGVERVAEELASVFPQAMKLAGVWHCGQCGGRGVSKPQWWQTSLR